MAAPESSTLPTVLNPETCVQKGLCTVTNGYRNKPRQLYYELHGELGASQKMVLIMGLTFPCSAWLEQVKHFGKKPDHGILVYDNRGVGNSDCGSYERYKTSDMAKDTRDLLDFLGWKDDRSIHLFGVSLGGTIAQELCLLIPTRIKSVTFISTTSGSAAFLPSMKVLKMFFKRRFARIGYEEGLDLMLDCLYPVKYLQQPTADGRTRRDELREHFATWNNVPRKQAPAGIFGQLLGGLTHHCPEESLEKIASDLHPAKIAVVTGDRDEMIYSLRTLELQDFLPGSELIVFKLGGHALSSQFTEEFNALMERIMDEGNRAFLPTK